MSFHIPSHTLLWVPKVWLLGLISTWARNLFVLWAFGFPTMGGPMLGNLDTPRFTQTILSTSQSYFLSEWLLFSFILLSRVTYPISSFSPPIYRRGWVEELWLLLILSAWLLLILSANGGPIPLSQSGRFVGKVGMALELIPTSDVCSVVTLLNAQPGSWVRCASNDWGGGFA